MDIDSTNINELPVIKNMNQDMNHEEMMNQMNLSSENVVIDQESIINKKTEKNVRFNDELDFEDTPKISPNDIHREKLKSKNYDIKLETKIIFLASIIFFVMMDNKVKKYFLNILVQIFGSFLKTEHGSMTQLGLFTYTSLYGLILYISIVTIDLGAMKFALDF